MLQYLTSENVYAVITILSLLSLVLRACGLVAASKVVGTISVDLGRVYDASRRSIRVRRLAKRAGLASFVCLLAVLGCAAVKSVVSTPSAWDAAKAACVLALTSSPKVVAAAEERGLTGNAWAVQLCDVSDVLQPWVVEALRDAEPKSLEAAQARGLVK